MSIFVRLDLNEEFVEYMLNECAIHFGVPVAFLQVHEEGHPEHDLAEMSANDLVEKYGYYRAELNFHVRLRDGGRRGRMENELNFHVVAPENETGHTDGAAGAGGGGKLELQEGNSGAAGTKVDPEKKVKREGA